MGPFNMGPYNMGPFNMGPFNIGAFFCGAFIHDPRIYNLYTNNSEDKKTLKMNQSPLW